VIFEHRNGVYIEVNKQRSAENHGFSASIVEISQEQDFMRNYILGLLILLFSTTTFAATLSPIGQWKTVDDVSGRVKSIVEIYEAPDHTLAGRILKTFPEPGVTPLTVCSACSGELHNQPIIGLTILTGLQPEHENTWGDGRIVEPRTGNVYHCTIKLIDGGSKLVIRGYILFQWMGRSQTWLHNNTPGN
jgi:uncharacterized protein (DUF2147 family)